MARRWPRAALGLVAALGAILAWQLAAELVEPRLLLLVADVLAPKTLPIEVPSVAGTRLRLYADTRPHVGKIAGLQKGLVWVDEGQELIEEGYGFGCPIVVNGGRAYVSSRSQTAVQRSGDTVTLIKHYHMDTIDTPVRLLRCKFCQVPSLGVVTVRYDIEAEGVIDVAVDFSGLAGRWQSAYLMNEQGARRFLRYRDDAGTVRTAGEIGIWEVTAAQRACFDQAGEGLGFCIEAAAPARLYFGRERTWLRNWRGLTSLSWSGIDLELQPAQDVYTYRISLHGAAGE